MGRIEKKKSSLKWLFSLCIDIDYKVVLEFKKVDLPTTSIVPQLY